MEPEHAVPSSGLYETLRTFVWFTRRLPHVGLQGDGDEFALGQPVLCGVGLEVLDQLVGQPAGIKPIIGLVCRRDLQELLPLGVLQDHPVQDPPGLHHLPEGRQKALSFFDGLDSLGVLGYTCVYWRITYGRLRRCTVVYVCGEVLEGMPQRAVWDVQPSGDLPLWDTLCPPLGDLW
jgi:hypothetical protein